MPGTEKKIDHELEGNPQRRRDRFMLRRVGCRGTLIAAVKTEVTP